MRRGLIVLAAAAAFCAAPQARGAAFTVNATDDTISGVCDETHCSLREAIIAANADATVDQIQFAIVPAGAKTIAPTSSLPSLIQPVTIDGTTQPGWIGPPIVELSGTGAGAGATGIQASAPGSTIRGLAVNSFTAYGVVLGSSSTLDWSYIGTGLTGSTDLGNGQAGVYAGSSNTIGGTAAGAGNLISGNGFTGVTLTGDSNTVAGNVIGLDAAGTSAIANCFGGIRVGGAGNVIGGTAAGAGNVISGNQGCDVGGWAGVTVYQSTGGNTIQGNLIGTNAAGTAVIPAGDIGVRIMGTDDNLIGGSVAGAANVITAPTTAVDISNDSGNLATGNLLRGNYIGTNAAGADLGSAGPGVVLAASGNSIGDTGAGGNVIAHSNSAGVYVITGAENRILGNSIFDNSLLGIDLAADGVTANDAGDADTGANDLQNFPVLTSAVLTGSDLAVSGTLASSSATAYRLDFFYNPTCDASGNGEGEEKRGFVDVLTGESGSTSFTASSSGGSAAVDGFVTATATDPDGNTSEFAACVAVTSGDPGATEFVVNSPTDPGEGTCNAANCTLREALNAANADTGTDTIAFAIDTGAVVISPTGQLPIVTDPVILDATTQPGYDGLPLIRLNGSGAGENTPGFEITGGGSTVRGFSITNFSWDAVKLRDGDGNTVEDNYLGLFRADGIEAGGNGTYGVLADFNSSANVIRRNVIGANGFGPDGPYSGIGIWHDSAATIVEDNLVGVGPAGQAFANAIGVIVSDSSGTQLSGNTIAHNAGAGVSVFGVALANRISNNLIDTNGGLGIDLGAAGVTANDGGDADTGPNDLQNFPVITRASGDIFSGTLNSRPSTAYRIEVFASNACDASGNGEGGRLLGGFDGFITNADGFVDFSSSTPLTVGEYITATAIDPDGNTSEFSACFEVQPAELTTYTVNSADDADDGSCNATHCSLREAINATNGDPGAEDILFAIDGPLTIAPDSGLPEINGPVTIDGTTQPGWIDAPIVVLSGANTIEGSGLELESGSSGSVIRGLVINGFGGSAAIEVRSDNNAVDGNYLGTNAAGTAAVPNSYGIRISGESTMNSIGESVPNLISGNSSGGIEVEGEGTNRIIDNLIGTNAAGNAEIPNGYGIQVSTDDNDIVGNVVSGNDGDGIHVDGSGNTVEQNAIGTDATGELDLGNLETGVYTTGSDNTFRENTIAYNGTSSTGMILWALEGFPATGNRITQNSIHSNVGLGIDLGENGVTENDEGDNDSGANGLQNFPVLTELEPGSEGGTIVSGTLSSASNSNYRIEFFSSAECNPIGHGEGQTFVGSEFVSTDAGGNVSFSSEVDEVDSEAVVTATATPAGEGDDPNTSEFSACLSSVSGAGELLLTSDERTSRAGARAVPLSAVPSSFLPRFSGRAAPVDSIPVDSIPVDSIPVDSIPVDSIPVDSIPVDSIGFELVPTAGLEQVLLSSLAVDWGTILAGTPLAARPLQTLTLADLRSDATAWPRFEALSFADSGLARSILRKLPTAALLLGKATLAQIPGGTAWCTQLQPQCTNPSTSTVAGLAIVGAPVDSIPVGSTPVDSIPVDSIPVDSIPVDSIDLAASRIGAILIRTLASPNAVVVCARISCTGDATLAAAAALSPSAIRPGARLSHLAGALGEITINDVILGILPRSALDWESLPIDGLQRFAPAGGPLHYHLTFTLNCANASGLAISAKLPSGYLVLPGTSRFAYGLGLPLNGADPQTASTTGATWTVLPGEPCPSAVTSQDIRLDFQALPGFRLGVGTASARVTAGSSTATADEQAPVLLTQNWEANDEPANVQTVATDQLVIGHVASSGDRELFRVPVPSVRGTRTTFYLSHIAADADFDLAIEQPPVASLQSNPVDSIPVDSIPMEDTGSSVAGQAAVIPPETLQDIPVDSIRVGSISANRGNADEVAAVVSQGETGFYTIVVSGYNGSHSQHPFVLRARQTPPPALPPCPARSFPSPAGTRGVLPASLPASTRTLFLLNRERLNRLYGSAAVNPMRTALVSPLLLGRPEVAGALLEMDGDATVRAAYAAWDASPCAVEAANAVVRSINAVVARYRASLPNLRNVVLLGTDEALPMARILDPTTISPESDNASALRFTTAGLTRGNALYAAAATSHFLSDAPYGSTVTIPWLNRQLYLPQLAVGRLVETPIEIQRQLALYVSANGLLAPASALTTAYNFLTDGGQAVKNELDGVVGAQASNGLISDGWDATQLRNAFTGKTPPDDILSVNAHYDHWRLQPAAGTELLSAASLPALPVNPAVEPAFARRIAFTMGCHGGLNVANSLLGTPLPPQALDWVEAYARQRTAVYVANTGFGYGDTTSNALSERLMSLFAGRLDQQGLIGELWVKALADYHLGAGAYGVYDEKVLQEATFYGLPFWRIGSGAPPSPPTPPGLANDPVSGLPVAQLTVTPSLAEHTTARGRYWEDTGKTTDIHYRPIQPRREVDVTVPGQTAKGVMITSLATNDIAGVNPATSLPTIDLSSHEPERDFRDTVFPANLVNLTTARRLGELQQRLVLNAGQFRPADPAGAAGIERLVLSIGLQVAYSSSPDATPPQIRFVASTFSGGQATILVEVAEAVRRVAALYNDTAQWRFAELTRVGTSNTWTATVTAAQPIEVAAMAQDTAGNVGYSTNKGFNFISVTDTSGPEILLESPAPGASFGLGERVVARYACSDAAGVATCTGTVPNGAPIDTSTIGPKTFTVTAEDRLGKPASTTVTYTVGRSSIVFASSRTGFGDIYAMGEGGSAAVRLTDHAAIDAEPAWSPDGSKIAFTSIRHGNIELYSMNANGSNVQRLTSHSGVDFSPAWSPDGSKIAFSSNRTGNQFDIYVVNADGSGVVQRLTTDPGADLTPAWSPNGAKIAFSSTRSGGSDIYVMNANGSAQTQLTTVPAIDAEPDWSPDGARIAFSTNRDGNTNFEIYAMNANGSSQSRLTNNPALDNTPSWSADGTRLLFSSRRDGNFELYRMNADGSNQARLTNDPAIDATPDW